MRLKFWRFLAALGMTAHPGTKGGSSLSLGMTTPVQHFKAPLRSLRLLRGAFLLCPTRRHSDQREEPPFNRLAGTSQKTCHTICFGLEY
jgi:hypothetical protein